MPDIMGMYVQLWPSNQRRIIAQMVEMIAKQGVQMQELWELMDRLTPTQQEGYLSFLEMLNARQEGKRIVVDGNYNLLGGEHP